jgi:hypothetical protein
MFNKKTDFVSMRKEFRLGMYIPVPISMEEFQKFRFRILRRIYL